MKVVAIVEGHGEVKALPVLLRRLGEWRSPMTPTQVLEPIRVRKDRFLNRDDDFNRCLQLAAEKCGDDGWVLVLLDADDDCPAERSAAIMTRAHACIGHRRVSVVLAKREYEAWFIAAARSLDGQRGLAIGQSECGEPETPRDAKGWIGRHMDGGTYREIADQPAFSARMDLQQAYDNSRSFRKLCAEWDRQSSEMGFQRN